MKNRTYEVKIDVSGGGRQTVTVQAVNPQGAQKVAEAQYKGCKIAGIPKEVKK